MIYTSYFNKVKKLDNSYEVVGITRIPPKNIKNCYFVAPSKELLILYKQGFVSQESYTEEYLKQLSLETENINRLVEYLKKYNDNKDKHIVMCCYEKSSDFCHRHILSKVLNEHGLNVSELGDLQ